MGTRPPGMYANSGRFSTTYNSISKPSGLTYPSANTQAVPELRIYKLWDKPIGPHPVAMFEVNLFTPAQFGAFIPWLVINRGPLSALVHPNTKEIVDGKDLSDEERDHTQRATWMGEPVILDLSIFKRMKAAAAARAEAAKA